MRAREYYSARGTLYTSGNLYFSHPIYNIKFKFLNNSFRNFSALALALFVFSASVIAQEIYLPEFDSFSYLRDPQFSGVRLAGSVEPVECITPPSTVFSEPEPHTKPETVIYNCPEVSTGVSLSQTERFELQLALDRALSQILKLTVDYETLRTRVENVDSTASNEGDSWFMFGNSGGAGEDKLQELLALNAKQLADRDQQIATLQIRLAAVQKRYDSENVSRLLAEKRLKIIKDKDKTSKKKGSVNSDKLRFLTELLEKNQKVILQLKIDLTDEKLKYAKLASEKKLSPVEPGLTSGVKGPVSSFNPAQEWVVEGLKFKQGSVDLELDSTQNLNELIEHLTQNSQLNIQINGYTDSVGSADSNLRLSQARADSVADYLAQQGMPLHRIKALGYEEQMPLADNQLEQGWQRNRRVAILFLN